MLTPNDGSTDGKFTSYLENSDKWAKHDPVLFHELKEMLAGDQSRCVGLIENTRLLHGADFFSIEVPDSAPGRREWFSQLSDRAEMSDFIFLDPDNGLEVKSRPYGRKSSSKFLYWQEVESLWAAGKSLLIYQHFIREKRVTYTQRMLEALKSVTPGSLVEAFSTSNVVFLMALQSEHQSLHAGILESVQNRWEGQIQSWG